MGRSLYSEARAIRAMDWEKEEMDASSAAWRREVTDLGPAWEAADWEARERDPVRDPGEVEPA
jgi:hypothetical protein